MAFCKEYNAATQKMAGDVIPVEISVYEVGADHAHKCLYCGDGLPHVKALSTRVCMLPAPSGNGPGPAQSAFAQPDAQSCYFSPLNVANVCSPAVALAGPELYLHLENTSCLRAGQEGCRCVARCLPGWGLLPEIYLYLLPCGAHSHASQCEGLVHWLNLAATRYKQMYKMFNNGHDEHLVHLLISGGC